MKPHTSLTPEEAHARVLQGITPGPEEEVPLREALHRVLARSLPARLEDPRFNKSAVDGFGVRADDYSEEYILVGSVTAGDSSCPAIGPGETVRIMTGARVPPGVEQVVKFENCAVEGDRVRIVEPERITNIALQGENIRVGDPLITARRLLPADIGVLAAQGYETVPVRPRPRVAVIATGDEIYPAGTELPETGIFDSNSYQLAAYAADAFAEVTNVGIVRDDLEHLTNVLEDAAARHDVVILSGGVSMGDLDFVPEALSAIGTEIVFHGLAMKPGRPTLYGERRTRGQVVRFFGLPGNPVSTAVQFEVLVRPLLWALEGAVYTPRDAMLPLAEPFRRRNTDRHEFLPGYIRDGQVHSLRYTGSGHLTAITGATLFYRIDQGVAALDAGQDVYVRFIR